MGRRGHRRHDQGQAQERAGQARARGQVGCRDRDRAEDAREPHRHGRAGTLRRARAAQGARRAPTGKTGFARRGRGARRPDLGRSVPREHLRVQPRAEARQEPAGAPDKALAPPGHQGRRHRRRAHGQPVRAALRAATAGSGRHHRPRPGPRRQGRRLHPRRDRRAARQGPHRPRRGEPAARRSSPARPTRPTSPTATGSSRRSSRSSVSSRRCSPRSRSTSSDDAILATNTSSLSVEQIGAEARAPGAARRLPLLQPGGGHAAHRGREGAEDQRRAPSPPRWSTAAKLRKNAVITRDTPGFVVNRVLAKLLGEAMHAVEQGTPFEVVVEALEPFGLPMDPFVLLDLVGLKVGAHVLDTHHGAFPDRFFESANLHELAEHGTILEKDAKGKVKGFDKKALGRSFTRRHRAAVDGRRAAAADRGRARRRDPPDAGRRGRRGGGGHRSRA